MLSAVHTFNLYELINKYFRNEEDSKKFLFEIDNFVVTKMNSGNHDLATKADVKKLDDEIGYIKKDVALIRQEVARLEIKMGEGFKEILKWIIILMVGFGSLIIASIKVFA